MRCFDLFAISHPFPRSNWLTAVLFAALFGLLSHSAAAEEPRVLDPRLVLERFAAEPDVVTPTGIAVDARGRVLVIESHTHFRPVDYDGPPTDRIRLLVDDDGDGRPERIDTFFEGTRSTMNLAVYPDGSVYVATRAEVLRMRDLDDDGRADLAQRLVRLETEANYPHNGLSGFAFDTAGRVYFGCGENQGLDYRLVGSDGSAVHGGGEGGNIFRCQPDGSQLVRVATGFWNPFHLCFDVFERLFAVDNDPDARPPCRLLHIVAGGDYGYRYRNGRRGLHPFTAWNGELPGTLPMVSGTGEAPSGVLAYDGNALPGDYRGQLLVTSWGDHRIDAFKLTERGASYQGRATPIVVGGEDFRPVGVAMAPDGSLFISDWVDKSYEVHRKGRVWRLRAAHTAEKPVSARHTSIANIGQRREHSAKRRAALYLLLPLFQPDAAEWLMLFGRESEPLLRGMLIAQANHTLLIPGSAQYDQAAPVAKAAALRRGDAKKNAEPRWQAATSDDPFVAEAARQGLSLWPPAAWLAQASHADPKRRLAALLLLRQCDTPQCREAIGRFLEDDDPAIRFAAVQWVAESASQHFRPALERQLASPRTSRELFEGLLAALERLDGVTRQPGEEQSGEQYVLKVLFDSSATIAVRRRALRAIRPDHEALTPERLLALAGKDTEFRRDVAQTLQSGERPAARDALSRIAADRQEQPAVRAAAIPGLSAGNDAKRALLVQLASEPNPVVRNQALRSLRGARLKGDEAKQLRVLLANADTATQELAQTVLAPRNAAVSTADTNVDAWMAMLDRPADAEEGERVFFHPAGPLCFRCHQIDGRGGRAGPDLTTTARVLDRRRLVESIVNPSKEIAPQFVNWQIEGSDGTVKQGVLISQGPSGEQIFADAEGKTFTIRTEDVARRAPLRESLMPAEMPRRMTVQDFCDLVAYLQTRK